MYSHVNGELVDDRHATVSIRDRGFLYGDAVFETLRAYNGKLFEWPAHADRLDHSCSVLGFDHGITRESLLDRITETLGANDLTDAYVRLSISRGIQSGLLTPAPTVDPTVAVIVRPLPRSGSHGSPPWSNPATVVIADTKRVPSSAIPATAKTHNYLNGILARLELRDTPATEAILLDQDGYLTEGATSNLFFVRDDQLCTPALDGPVLPGITRRVVLDHAESMGLTVVEDRFTPDDVRTATDAFLTNTTWELRPIARLGTTSFESGPMYNQLRRAFTDHLEAKYYSPG